MFFSPRRRRFAAGLLLAPLLTGCFASDGGDTSSDGPEGSRLRVAPAFPPAENFSRTEPTPPSSAGSASPRA